MSFLDLLILSLIQGVTEFLPISSSGHLALWPLLTGRPDQGPELDVATHIGTLAAVVLYFRAESGAAIRGAFRLLRLDFESPDARLALLLAVATAPAVLLGALLALSGALEGLRSIEVIGWTSIAGGLLLGAADRWGRAEKRSEGWTLRDAALIGLAQMLALVPGMSRAGVTVTAARALGYGRVDAARISLLTSMPVVLAAGLFVVAETAASGDMALGGDIAVAALLSFAVAYGVIWAFMRMLKTWTMNVFVVYRLILGAVLLWLAYA